MSNELLEIFRKNINEKIVAKLALECAPLLSGLRIANIININRHEFSTLKYILKDTDIMYYLVSSDNEKLSLILYREQMMKQYLNRSEVKRLLKHMGYPNGNIYELMYLFSLRYRNFIDGKQEFPHEMGIFLGYPVEDVIGYIKNDGRNFLMVGYWKVYHNKNEKDLLFEKFEEAKELMVTLISYGISIKEVIRIFDGNRYATDAH